jgi:hypothetical protein
VVPNEALSLRFVEFDCASLLIWLTARQRGVDQSEQAVSDGHQRTFPIAASGQAPEPVMEKAVLLYARCPGAFDESSAEPSIPVRDVGISFFACTPCIAGTDPRPRTQVSGRGKRLQIRADFREYRGSRILLNTRDALQQPEGFLER